MKAGFKEAYLKWRQLNVSISKMEQNMLKLAYHPDATAEQLKTAAEALANLRPWYIEVHTKLTNKFKHPLAPFINRFTK